MAKSILIRGARQLLTLNGPAGPRRGAAARNVGLIEDGSVLIADGRIAEVGPTRRVENLRAARGAEEIDAAGKVVMPAFVDMHTGLLGSPSPASRFGIADTRRLEAQARRILRFCLQHGTCTVEVRAGWGGDSSTDLRLLRAAARLADTSILVVPAYAEPAPGPAANAPEWFDAELFPRIRARRLAAIAGASCGQPAASAYREVCRRHGFRVKLSCAETTTGAEISAALSEGVRVFEGLQHIAAPEAAALAGAGAIALLMPALAFRSEALAQPPARLLLDSGVAVAIASGFRTRDSGTFSMQMVVALACSQLRMNPAEAITAATINAAHAAGVEEIAGSLQHGKQADILILDISDYREMIWYFGSNVVATVLRNGEWVAGTAPRMHVARV